MLIKNVDNRICEGQRLIFSMVCVSYKNDLCVKMTGFEEERKLI